MIDKTRYRVNLRRIGSRDVEQEATLLAQPLETRKLLSQLVASQDATFFISLAVFERQIVQLVYQHLFEFLIHLTFYLETTTLEAKV